MTSRTPAGRRTRLARILASVLVTASLLALGAPAVSAANPGCDTVKFTTSFTLGSASGTVLEQFRACWDSSGVSSTDGYTQWHTTSGAYTIALVDASVTTPYVRNPLNDGRVVTFVWQITPNLGTGSRTITQTVTMSASGNVTGSSDTDFGWWWIVPRLSITGNKIAY
jgi:hypothetical protein